jgi:hypothetical protein
LDKIRALPAPTSGNAQGEGTNERFLHLFTNQNAGKLIEIFSTVKKLEANGQKKSITNALMMLKAID